MNGDPRIHVRRRRRAIDRLQSLTTGAAVAGIAGTAGFSLLAAASWSGVPGATTAADVGGAGLIPTNPSGNGSSGASTPRNQPQAGTTDPFATGGGSGSSGSSGTTRVRPAQPGTGRSHATSGGSH
jgi:hypothetical protein